MAGTHEVSTGLAPDRGIAHVGLAVADQTRLKAILGIAVAGGGLAARWRMCDAADACLVVVGAGSSEGARFVAQPDLQQGKVVAVLAGESDQVPAGCTRLPWPIRLEHVLALLKRIEQTPVSAPSAKRSAAARGPESHLVRFASLLRDAATAPRNLVWRISGMHKRSIYVALGERAFYFADSLAHLRTVDPDVELEFVPVPAEAAPGHGTRRPIVMLQWTVGLLNGPIGLLPWIDAAGAFRLKRFPEFQMLHHAPSHRRMAAALARPRHGLDQVVALTESDSASAAGFINAASLCGYLTVLEAKEPAAAAPRAPSGSRRALFSSFRRALGIATANG